MPRVPWKEKAILGYLFFPVLGSMCPRQTVIVLTRATAEYPCGGVAATALPFIIKW